MTNSPLWTAEEAAKAVGGTLLGSTDWQANGVSIDSRTLETGDLFVALTGPNQNGHAYVKKALEAGAAACLVSEEVEGLSEDAPLLRVKDTLEGLNNLGIAARKRSAAKRIAVTGSVGKTTTKEMLRSVLDAQQPSHASVASYNNLWGVPLTLARMPADTTYGVFEIGMNHKDEITPLTRLVEPDVAIITTVAPVHLEFFKDVDEIAMAKAEIFDGLKPGGTAIINADIPQYELLREAAQNVSDVSIVPFGESDMAESTILSIECSAEGSHVQARIMDEEVSYFLPMPGKHLAVNSLAVLSAVASVGADVQQAAKTIEGTKAVDGRGVRTEVEGPKGAFTVVDESYNANPVSMAAAIRTLGTFVPATSEGRRIAVLGDMLELGPDADQLHKSLDKDLIEAQIDLAFLSGPHMKSLWDALPNDLRGAYRATSAELHQSLADIISEGDIVMIKGSLGSKMGPIVKMLQGLEQ